jgi:hypothetical protein
MTWVRCGNTHAPAPHPEAVRQRASLWRAISRISNPVGACVLTRFNRRVALALSVGGVDSKSNTDYAEQRQHHQHWNQYDPLLSFVIL